MKKQCLICPIIDCGLQDDESVLHCPINKFLGVLGGKRSLIVLLLLEKPHRFGEIKKIMSDISEKMLISTLRLLERKQLITREAHIGKHLKTIYSITDYGKKTIRIAHDIAELGKTM